MPAFKRSKSARYRGSKTHGSGAKKKRRGAGNRGGRGRAGAGKKGDGRRPSFWHETMGRSGFKSHTSKTVRAINLAWLSSGADGLVRDGKAHTSGSAVIVNLSDLGYDKLLSKGTVMRPFQITVKKATPQAIEKVNAAGGSITVLEGKDSKAEAEEE